MNSRNYEDEVMNKSNAIISPVIPSRYLESDSKFWLFIPLAKREKDLIYDHCEQGEVDETKPRYKRNDARKAMSLSCIKERLKIYINENRVTDYFIKLHDFHHKNEPGVLLFFKNESFQNGENVLKVEHFWKDEEGLPKIDKVVFYQY